MPHSIRPGRYVDSVIRIFRGGALADGRQAVLPSSCHPGRQRRLPAVECGCPATRAAARAHRGQLRHVRLLGKPVFSGIQQGRSALPVATRRLWPTMLLYSFVRRHHCPLRPEAKFVSHHRGQDTAGLLTLSGYVRRRVRAADAIVTQLVIHLRLAAEVIVPRLPAHHRGTFDTIESCLRALEFLSRPRDPGHASRGR